MQEVDRLLAVKKTRTEELIIETQLKASVRPKEESKGLKWESQRRRREGMATEIKWPNVGWCIIVKMGFQHGQLLGLM